MSPAEVDERPTRGLFRTACHWVGSAVRGSAHGQVRGAQDPAAEVGRHGVGRHQLDGVRARGRGNAEQPVPGPAGQQPAGARDMNHPVARDPVLGEPDLSNRSPRSDFTG